MKKNFMISIWMTIVTTLLLGIVYPFVVTGLAQLLFPRQANGGLITMNGNIVGAHLIGQPFSSPGYFRSRPSAAGTGYDAGNSSGFCPKSKNCVRSLVFPSRSVRLPIWKSFSMNRSTLENSACV